MSHLQRKTTDYGLMTTVNNSVNSLMPYCFFGLHLTFRLERGLKRQNFCTHTPFIIFSPNETLL